MRPLIMQTKQRPLSGSFPEVVLPHNTDSPEVSYEDGLHFHKSPVSTSRTLGDEPPESVNTTYSAIKSETSETRDLDEPAYETRKTSHRKLPWLLALGVFLLTATALGAGLGVPLAKCQSKLNPNSYAPIPASNVTSVQTGKFCDSDGNLTRKSKLYTASAVFHFDLYCGKDFRAGYQAFNPVTQSGIANGTITDLVAIVAYSVTDCINACVSMNNLVQAGNSDSPPCQSITFLPNMKDLVLTEWGNCFLKNATINDLTSAYDNVDAVSAEVYRLRKE